MTSSTGQDASPYLRHDKPLWRRLLLRSETALLVATLLIIVLSLIFISYYAQPYTVSTLVQDSAPILLLVPPMTLIIAMGDIDLSVGSVLGLSSASFGLMYQAGIPLPVSALISILIGGMVGVMNGLLVAVVGLPSLAVTIGTLALFRGVAVGMLGTTAVTNFPPQVTLFFNAQIPGTPLPVVTVGIVVIALAFGVLLHLTSFGRGLYAIGLSPEMAMFSGVPVRRTKLTLFVLSGLISAAVGVYFTLDYSDAIGSNGNGFELRVVTAIVLGGVSIWGGRGTMIGAVAGGLAIAALNKSLQLLGVGDDAIYVITGGALILSVVVASVAGFTARRRRGTATPLAGGE
jgi:rhamnose transport system permease protein